MEKEGKNKSECLGFLSHNILGPAPLIGAENSVSKFFIGEKEKWTNKGNDKKEVADSPLHNTTSHTQHLYQISKSKVQ